MGSSAPQASIPALFLGSIFNRLLAATRQALGQGGLEVFSARILSRAIPCSDRAQQRHKIIRKTVALLGDESVSVVTVGTEPTATGDPTHARLYHCQ
jgi:hypothetical protein